jgi:hypothetical protein
MIEPTIRSEACSVAGDVWTAVITGVQHIHSLVLEAWGANGGIVRVLPRGRGEVSIDLRFAAPGPTMLSLTSRDERLGTLHAFATEVEVAQPGTYARSPGPHVWARQMAGRTGPSFTRDGPHFQVCDRSGREAVAASDQRYGDMNGPGEAEVGETIHVRFTTPMSAVSVKFEASNAVVGFVGPMPVYDVTAEMSARMMVEGSATIYATAYDNGGMAVHEAAHVVQVRSKRTDSPGNNLLTELALDMERSIEQRIREGLNLKR